MKIPFKPFLIITASLAIFSLITACDSSDKEASNSTVPPIPISATENQSDGYWMNIAKDIDKQVNEAVSLAEKNKTKLATRAMTKVYFQTFEGSKMETALRVQISPKHMLKVEGLFGDLRKSITEKVDIKIMEEQAQNIVDAVTRDAKVLDDAGIDAALLEGM